ncbi:MAG TPA: DUF3500 domain-containing protein [Tepidisphaeraceae bacterium]|jgi:hypothetical protein
MRLSRVSLFLLAIATTPFFTPSARGESPGANLTAATPDLSKASADMAQAAKKFLDCLSPEQLATAGFDFKSNERLNWHFIPKPRNGLTLKDMSEDQRALAKALLASGLSEKADHKALTIMSMEQILHDMEQRQQIKGPRRDPEMYYWSVFGQPGGDQPWGWRVEGHHVSINFTIVGDKAVATGPEFLGANPAEVREGPRKGLRVLAEEEDQGRAFVKSLDADQLKKAIFSQAAPKEIVTGNERQAMLQKFEGIPFSDLNDVQKSALIDLIKLYADRLRPELAQDDLRRVAQAGLDKIYFGWAGGLEKGQPHYYRIHGPNVLIEYDDTQNEANHIHTVWRDLENDFGGDLLRKHYDQDHK